MFAAGGGESGVVVVVVVVVLSARHGTMRAFVRFMGFRSVTASECSSFSRSPFNLYSHFF